MVVDRDVVQRKITLIAEDLARLRPLARLTLEEYLARTEAQLATERLLERMIGRMLDINYHVAVEVAGLAPRDFHESFPKMADLDILPTDFARRIARAAGLRNRLAHEYNELDPVVGSSRKSISGLPTSASARSSRRRSPPLSRPT